MYALHLHSIQSRTQRNGIACVRFSFPRISYSLCIHSIVYVLADTPYHVIMILLLGPWLTSSKKNMICILEPFGRFGMRVQGIRIAVFDDQTISVLATQMNSENSLVFGSDCFSIDINEWKFVRCPRKNPPTLNQFVPAYARMQHRYSIFTSGKCQNSQLWRILKIFFKFIDPITHFECSVPRESSMLMTFKSDNSMTRVILIEFCSNEGESMFWVFSRNVQVSRKIILLLII